jgi:hypothetical protein
MITLLSVIGPILVVIAGALVIHRARELGNALHSYSRSSRWTLWFYPAPVYPWLVRLFGLGMILLVLFRVAELHHFIRR